LKSRAGSLGIRSVQVFERTNYPISLYVFPGTELTLRMIFDIRRFEASTAERMLGHLQTLLGAMARGAEQRLADLSMMTDAEQARLLRQWDDPDVPLALTSASAASPNPADLDRLPESELDLLIGRFLGGGEASNE